VSKLNL